MPDELTSLPAAEATPTPASESPTPKGEPAISERPVRKKRLRPTPAKKTKRKKIGSKKPRLTPTESESNSLESEAEVAAAVIAPPRDRAVLTNSLKNIYQDEQGNVPDMKTIEIEKYHWGRWLLESLAILGLGAAAAWLAWGWFTGSAAPPDPGTITVSGPSALALGEFATYTIEYANASTQPLREAVLNVQYPAGFVLATSSQPAANTGNSEWAIGEVPPKTQGKLQLTGRLFGSLNSAGAWRVTLRYQPGSFKSELQAVAALSTVVTTVPLTLAVSGPETAALQAPAEYVFRLSLAETFPGTLELAPERGAGFQITSSTPPLNKNSRWVIGDLSASSTRARFSTSSSVFVLRGMWSGTSTLAGPVGGTLWITAPNRESIPVARTTVTTTVVKSNVMATLAINGSLNDLAVAPGDRLTVTVQAQNNSDQTLRRPSLKLVFDAPSRARQSALQWADFEDPADGTVVGEQRSEAIRRGTVTWTAAELPAFKNLKPGDTVSVDVTLPLRDTKNFDWSSLAAAKILASAELNFTDASGAEQTVASNPVAIRLRSNLKFENRDSVTTDPAGETHQITWLLTNTFHTLKNVEVAAEAFGDISFASASPTPAGTVSFNPTSKKITWRLPVIPEEADVLALPFTLTLQSRNPTQTALVSRVRITATDAATNEVFEIVGEETPLNR